MDLLRTLKYYLNQNSIDPVYISFKPATPDTCTTILVTPGLESDFKHNYDRDGIQIVDRGNDYDEALQRSNSTYSLLHGMGSMTISGIHIVSIRALQKPFLLRYDGQNRPEFITNYTVETYNSTIHRV